MNELLDIVCETIERGDFDQAANHCGILLEHLMQAGASDETLARSIGRLEDVKHQRAKQEATA